MIERPDQLCVSTLCPPPRSILPTLVYAPLKVLSTSAASARAAHVVREIHCSYSLSLSLFLSLSATPPRPLSKAECSVIR